MGVEPPFLYDPPSRYSFRGPTEKGYNPKAATVASWTPSVPKPKKDGPLVDFNKHPDSYLIIPYGNVNAKPMNPRTKSTIKGLRVVQLVLRICALLGAVGMLICVICIKGTSGTVGWIIRVAPAVAILHTLYAIYHLCRAAKGRTPASTASYMLFAAMIDVGLIPFLVFSAMISQIEYTQGSYGWDTLFGTPSAAHKIVYATFLFSATNGGLHLISLVLSVYLAVLFRKIAKLPPDMNPLEDNLTARPHKRNKSELSQEHLGQVETAPSRSNRISAASDPLIAPSRNVPFMHTRTESTDSLDAHRYFQPSSKRGSRVDLPSQTQLYQNSNLSFRSSRADLANHQEPLYEHTNHSARSSRADLPTLQQPLYQHTNHSARSSRADLPTLQQPLYQHTNHSARSSRADLPTLQQPLYQHANDSARSSRADLPTLQQPLYQHPNHSARSSRVNLAEAINRPSPSRPTSAAVSPPKSKAQNQPAHSSLLKDSWFTDPSSSTSPANDENEKPEVSPPSSRGSTPDSNYMVIKDWNEPSHHKQNHNQDYQRLPQPYQPQNHQKRQSLYDFDRELATPDPLSPKKNKALHPLEMNPPTPNRATTPTSPHREPRRIALTDGDVNTLDNNNYNARPGQTSSRPSSFIGSGGKSRFYGDLSLGRGSSIGKAKGETCMSDSESVSEYSTIAADDVDADDDDGRGRVVSNSGVDLGEYHYGAGAGAALGTGLGLGMGMGRRRDVSGKVAEEGRADVGRQGEVRAGGAGGAAGWARWRGM